ncbi:MAG: hypothetical protein H5T74_04435 [Actinobacteria bacterium]|nr:hypothetical protein [Actinomycetota bacterium]
MKKVIIVVLVAVLCAGGVVVAAWRMTGDGAGEGAAASADEPTGDSFQHRLAEVVSTEGEAQGAEEPGEAGEASASDLGGAASEGMTGEDFAYTTPDQRYVTETQRHQNFFRAVAEGRVLRLEVVSADVRPVGDPNTSYIKFVCTISDGGSASGTMVMKYDAGMWRIAAISQLTGDLQGGTNYQVSRSFEDVLAREIAELQPFLARIAEGRFAYMEVHGVSRPSENETVLTGVVAGKSGKTVPAEMRLRRDYGIWHLTYITNPP